MHNSSFKKKIGLVFWALNFYKLIGNIVSNQKDVKEIQKDAGNAEDRVK